MLKVRLEGDGIRFGERLTVSLQRTLRIPDDGRHYPLPPGLGAFPARRVADYAARVPPGWRERGGVFVPVYQREALWLGFDGAEWKPNAVKVGVGGVNAISGAPWDGVLRQSPQDYIVCPQQPWLDGINAGRGFIRQFVAMPLGAGSTVEGQLTGEEVFGGIQLLVFEPRPGRFPDAPPPHTGAPGRGRLRAAPPRAAGEMGLGAGGRMKQKIYPDPLGVDAWDEGERGHLFVHMVNSEQYEELTGEAPPPTPIDARTYTEHGLPWFDLYDEAAADLPAPDSLAGVKSVGELEAAGRGASAGGDASDDALEIPDSQVDVLSPHGRGRR
jgi:hypothetical protein